ncbi:MAG: response regulator [Candidatus Thiodiazotropha sp. (ex Dulcina madagascariensis)]|nr:response regulator [Candidatus Thiodiazotropha sp. (ex Dulcina madagascariensis)]
MSGERGADILVVDDNPDNLHLLTDMLAGQGYVVRPAASGRFALRAVVARSPDLILLDFRMPEMDGIQVCERLKADEGLRDIPVIFVSALDDISDKLRGFAVGGVDFVVKPFTAEEVLARVDTHLALRDLQLRLEQRVAERTAELEEVSKRLKRSNEELQAFAYGVSHDLQEPLRMVSNYLHLLRQRYQGRLDKDAGEFIGFAVDGAQRMSALIDGLLQFSRVETQGQPFVETDMEAVLGESLSNLRLMLEEHGGEVEHGPLPTVNADASQMVRLLQNLIGNALKFHGKQPPRVRIEAARQGDEWEFSVADNGIGIPPDQAKRIFSVFQRIHTRKAYPGMDIGLEVSRRIVERHGGRIWVDSEPGVGSTFHFTLLPADVSA